jgi:transcriptional regulator with XRE-family HTH domain
MGKQIRAYRRGAKMSQYHLAKMARVSMKHLGEIERGDGNATVTTLLLISRALDVSVAQFFRLDDESISYYVTERDLRQLEQAMAAIRAAFGPRRRAKRT